MSNAHVFCGLGWSGKGHRLQNLSMVGISAPWKTPTAFSHLLTVLLRLCLLTTVRVEVCKAD
jgi:hypothetical protein